MDTTTAVFLNGLEAGRFQGWEEGRQAGYRDGYADGHLAGHRSGWNHHEDVDRIAFDNWMSEHGKTLGQPSYEALTRIRNDPTTHPMKPLKTPAECLATWSTP